MMLGVEGSRDGATQSMTAQFDDDHGPIWIFTAKDHDIVQALDQSSQAIAAYASKGHDLYASIRGRLSAEEDRASSITSAIPSPRNGTRARMTPS